MENDLRREFLKRLALTYGGLSLSACAAQGDAESDATLGASPSVTSAPAFDRGTNVAAPVPAVVIEPPSSQIAAAPSPPATPPVGLPAWLAGAELNQWIEIPGSVHAGSPAAPTDDPTNLYCGSNNRLAFCGAALKGTELFLAAAGGHDDYSGNQVTSIDIGVDNPQWQLRHAATPPLQRTKDAAYYADGKPSSRHTYWSSHYSAYHNRVFLFGCRAAYGTGGFTASVLDGFNPNTNAWDPAGTWPSGGGIHCIDSDGNGWGVGINLGGFIKWTKETATSATVATFDPPSGVPLAHDSKRNQLFSLSWGSGEDLYGTASKAYKYPMAGTSRTLITFNASDAWTKWQQDRTEYGAMEYDPDNDRFLFYDGRGLFGDERDLSSTPRMGRIYVIKPNSGNVWDMNILSLAAGSITPASTLGAGVLNRFRYVPALRGFVLMARGTSSLYFLRTA